LIVIQQKKKHPNSSLLGFGTGMGVAKGEKIAGSALRGGKSFRVDRRAFPVLEKKISRTGKGLDKGKKNTARHRSLNSKSGRAVGLGKKTQGRGNRFASCKGKKTQEGGVPGDRQETGRGPGPLIGNN